MNGFTSLRTVSPVADTLLSIAMMLLAGLCLTRLAKKFRMPDVTAYIIAGICLDHIASTSSLRV